MATSRGAHDAQIGSDDAEFPSKKVLDLGLSTMRKQTVGGRRQGSAKRLLQFMHVLQMSVKSVSSSIVAAGMESQKLLHIH